MNPINIKIENLGNIKKANIEIGKLTILSGPNNSGKTYLNYILYAFLERRFQFRNSFFKDIVKYGKQQGTYKLNLEKFLNEKFEKLKNNVEITFKKSLDNFFSAENETFKDFNLNIIKNINDVKKRILKQKIGTELKVGKNNKIVCKVEKEENDFICHIIFYDSDIPLQVYEDFISSVLIEYIFEEMNNEVFLMPAERTGLNLFYKELNDKRNALVNHLQKNKIDPMDVIRDLIISKYPQPIADYISFLNNLNNLKKNKSHLEFLNKLLHKMIQGKYGVDKDGSIFFKPYKKNFKGNNFKNKIDLHLSSSAVKTFFSLEFYIQHMAKDGSYLIIDEPELNLHPDNQRKMARLLAYLVDAGVNVILTTHSDYIIKEFNNLIMLSNEFETKKEIMEKFDYNEEDRLNPEYVNAYLVNNGEVKKVEIAQEGIIMETFDDVINQLNESSDEIYYALQEEKYESR